MKQFTKRAISMLLAILMVVTMIPTFAITAFAAKENINVWNCNNFSATASETVSNGTGFSATDSTTGVKLQGIHWGSGTKNSDGSLKISNATLSNPSSFAGLGINGTEWTFSAKYTWDGSTEASKNGATIFGIGNGDSGTVTGTATGTAGANLVNIVKYDANTAYVCVGGSGTKSAQIPLSDLTGSQVILSVAYNSGKLSVWKNETNLTGDISVDSAKFEKGVANFFVSASSQAYQAGQTDAYCGYNTNGSWVNNFNLYSIFGSKTTGEETSTEVEDGGAEIESLVWKYDAAKATNGAINSQTNLTDNQSVSGKTSTITVVPNGSGSYNDTTKVITHIENGYAYGTINDIPADCNHWKLTFRFAYTGNQNNGNVPVFAIGRSSSSVLVKVMSNGDYYISGTKIDTITNPSALNCASVDDVRTASFEYNNGTLSFNIAGVEQFSCSNSTYVINAQSHFVGGLKYFATGDSANQISGMNLSKIIAASMTSNEAKIETKSGTLNQNGYQILCNGTEGRWSNNQWNIVNDREANNTSAGVVRIPLADVKNMQVNSATFKMTVDTASGDSECNGLDVYWSTDYAKINGYIAGGQTNSVGCSSGSGTTANDSFATKLGFSRTGSLVATYPKSTTGEQSFNIKSTMQSIIDTNADYLYLIVMQKNAGGQGSNSGWSDTKIKPTSLSITYNVQNKPMQKSEVQTKLNAFNDHSGFTSDYGSFAGDKTQDFKSGTGYTTYMRNVLYGQKGADYNSAGSSSGKTSNVETKIIYPQMVLVYDGKANLDTPVLVNFNSSDTGIGKSAVYAKSAWTDVSGLTLVNMTEWQGTDKSENWAWLYSNSIKNDTGKLPVNSNNNGPQLSAWSWGNNDYRWANMFRFNGSFGESEYIKSITPVVRTKTSGNFGEKAITGKNPLYYVNYKPVLDKIDSAKTDLNALDPNKYTTTSLQAYYDSIIALVSYDITSAGGKISSSNVAGGAQTVANELKALVDNYNTAKAGLVKINTVTFQYNNGKKLIKKVLDGNTCTVPDDNSPAKIEKYSPKDEDNHKVTRYYWGPADAKITADVTYTEKTNISGEPHAWQATAMTVDPTCEEQGYTVYQCTICGETSHQDLVDPAGHTYRPNQGSAVAPSNYKNGETYDAEKDYKHAIDCIISSSHTKKEESCNIGASWTPIDEDTEKSTCSVCGGYVTRAIIHGYDIVFKDVDGNVIATNPTMEGDMPSTPNLLNYAYIDDEGHHSFSWNKEVVEATEATEYQMVENELVPHAYADNYTEITAPTCYAEGLEADPCTVSRDCEYSKTRPIEKIAHSFGAWAYDEEQQKQYHTCTVEECKKTEYDECSFEVTEDVEPTCTEQGHTTYTCTECGGSYTEYSLPLGHDLPANWTSLGNSKHQKACSRCDYTEQQDCVFATAFTAPTCTVDGYYSQKCNTCGYDAERLTSFDLSYFPGSPAINTLNVEGNHVNTTKEYTLSVPAGTNVNSMELTFDINFHTGNSNHAGVYIYDASGNELFYSVKNPQIVYASGKRTNNTFSNVKVTVPGTYARVVTNGYFDYDTDYIKFKDIKVNATFPAKGHTNVNDNNFSVDGLLGTHTCSVCHETTEHTLDLKRSGSNIVVSCTSCDFSQVLHTTASTVTVTENNMFDTDKFIRSHNAEGTNETSKGLACFRRTDGKAVVVGNGDNYTSHDRENDYIVPVEGGKTYQFDFDASTTYGDVMLFFRGAGNGYDTNYLNMRKSGTAVGKNTIEFTVPEGGKQLYIRIGTNGSGDRNAYCVFSNFALHEKDDPNYRMIKDVPMGSAINDYFTGVGTEAICHYEYKNSTISYADGAMATGTTFNRNVNVVKSAQHDIYKEFSNGTVSHFYCITCGYNYDKETSLNMVYRESFDNASVSGSTFTSSNGNGTLANSGTGSIVEYAGGQDKGALYSNVRHNVLKLNANATKPGNWMKLDTNPLTDPATAEKAKQDGITISFWRHMEKNGATANLAEDKNDNSGYKWRNALSFEQDGNAGNRYYIEVNGVQSRCAVDGQDYTDLIPYYNDNTTKGTPNYTGDWVHIAVTIDPNDKVNGGTLYINGVPREYDLTRTKGVGKYVLSDTMNPGDIAADVINFLTQSNTGFYFNNGDPWEGNDFDMFYDDVRIYTGVMTQLQINQMYGAPDSDTPSTNSITHDPTNVTVYTLKAGTYTAANGSGDTYVAEAGKTVGEEFINYYGVDVATQVSNIEYYSFGTGMVVEKSSNGVDWTLVGDSKGHFAYQNEDLFGGKYTDVLSEPLNYAKQGASGGGYLLWAPHVMYNLTLNKWVIYESTSSWGSQFSTIFYCTSDTVYKDYAYQGMIHKTNSSSKCNAIDSDVYYGRDENGIIDKSTLYLAYGSYCWNGSNIAIWGRELTDTGENKPGVDSTWNESVDYPCIKADGSSSEGIYVYYYDGYYYMFTTYGGNDNNYTEVYFRSENPNGPFVRADGVNATAGTGMFFQSSYKNPVETYTYWSNGHNSVYTVYNNNNEPVLINAAHSRVLSDGTVQSEEGQIITNQTDIRGNLMISNLIATTKSGWIVMFPLQYNGTDTTKLHLTAEDVAGTYDAINNIKSTSNAVQQAETMTITACDDVHLWINGTLFALEYDADKDVTYIVGETIEGAFAKHNDTIEFSFFNKSTLQHTWGYQTAKGDASTATHDKTTVVTNEADVYTWTTTCSKCDLEETKVVDIAAYNASVATAQVEIDNVAKYTKDSRDELATYIIELDLTAESTLTQDVVDGYNTALTTANKVAEIVDGESNGGVLVLNEYKVTFILKNDNTDEDKTVYEETHKFDDVVNLKAENVEIPYKWVRTLNGKDEKVAEATDEFTLVVAGTTTVVAHYGTKASENDQSIITVYNRTNKVVGYLYVTTGSTLTYDASTITVDRQKFTVPKTPFYQIDGFKVEGKAISNGYEVDGNISLYPNYQPQNEIGITLGSEGISFDDTSDTTKKVLWDHVVTVKTDDESTVIWYVDGVAVAKGSSYTFRATNSMTITVANVAEAGSTTITYAAYSSENKAVKVAASSYKSDDFVIAEQGLLVATSKSTTATLDQAGLIAKGKKFVATKTTGTGDQFSYSLALGEGSTVKTVCVLSYVTYENGTTAYSEVSTIRI